MALVTVVCVVRNRRERMKAPATSGGDPGAGAAAQRTAHGVGGGRGACGQAVAAAAEAVTEAAEMDAGPTEVEMATAELVDRGRRELASRRLRMQAGAAIELAEAELQAQPQP
eukprot:scaffold119662_cov45-Phaeocystis_antarctica.AAC.1